MLNDNITIERATELPDLSALFTASLVEGFGLVQRTIDDFQAGLNRFDHPGEMLLVARDAGGQNIGICGLNIDPYAADPTIGRVRHLYVLPGYRRRGVGRELLKQVIEAARPSFRRLHLRTRDAAADALYCSAGFARFSEQSSTHYLDFGRP
ncbi:MAG: GNAT family N-acetyltransferase [Tepidisphaeraceae bacterium]